MQISAIQIAVGAAVLISVVAFGWTFKIMLRPANYTRERFAFASLTCLTGMAATVLSSLAHKETVWGSASNLVRQLFRLPAAPDPPRIVDHLLMVFVLCIV